MVCKKQLTEIKLQLIRTCSDVKRTQMLLCGPAWLYPGTQRLYGSGLCLCTCQEIILDLVRENSADYAAHTALERVGELPALGGVNRENNLIFAVFFANPFDFLHCAILIPQRFSRFLFSMARMNRSKSKASNVLRQACTAFPFHR